ncbi:hypothetical protein LFM09_16060 [Lentzea alba]|uniref:hypothetical protein n=1 Tax=Lentzea alba TaxID=2714351 RepID=UPI0039BEF6B9
MRNALSGWVTGTSVQIGDVKGDFVLRQGGPAGRKPTEPRPSEKPKLTAGHFIVGVLILFIGGIINACNGDTNSADAGFPSTDQGSRPAGISDDMIAQLVADKLRQCATEVVLTPVNCPQTHTASSARNVRWELVGDPRDGMQVRWHNDKFLARGTAVMTISYDAGTRQSLEIKRFHFETEVQWRGAESRIESIRQPTTAPPPGTITKDRFTLPDGDLVRVVREGFVTCASATAAPMPRMCPRATGTPAAQQASWSLEGEPVGNWTSARDAEFGLLRLTASYSLVVRWNSTVLFLAANHSHTQAGTYEATIVRTPNKTARLLQIKHVP